MRSFYSIALICITILIMYFTYVFYINNQPKFVDNLRLNCIEMLLKMPYPEKTVPPRFEDVKNECDHLINKSRKKSLVNKK